MNEIKSRKKSKMILKFLTLDNNLKNWIKNYKYYSENLKTGSYTK